MIVERLWTEEDGQGMAEYILILALVALVLISSFSAVQNAVALTLAKVLAGFP